LLSPQDARDFCIVAAQVVPTLLIALFVVNRVAPSEVKQTERVQTESSDLLTEINSNKESINENLEEAKALLETTNDLRERIEIQKRITRALEVKESITKLSFTAQVNKDKAEKLAAGSRVETRRTLLLLSIYTAVTFAAGIAAEWFAIAGILKVVDIRTAARFSAGTAVLITCTLALESWRALLLNNQSPAIDTRIVRVILEGINLVIACSPVVLIPLLTYSL